MTTHLHHKFKVVRAGAQIAENRSRIGVRPLNDEKIARLTSRVREVEQMSDMSAFFEGIY